MCGSRPYQIRDGIPFRTGSLANGDQILLSRFGSYAVAVLFSAIGQYLRYDSYPIGPESDFPDSEIDTVFRRLGATPGVIRFAAFSIPEYGIETRDVPDYLQEYIDTPAAFPEDTAVHLKEAVEAWMRSGGFVLIWGNDYEISRDGEIESS